MAKKNKKIKRTLANRKKNKKSSGKAKISSQQRNLQQALALHQAGRFTEAETLYRQILASEPNQADALHYLGMLAYQVGRNDIAIDLIIRALRARPDYINAHNNLGIVYNDVGKFKEAVACFQEALTLKPDYAEVHFNLANAFKDIGRIDEAAASYRRALSLKPDYAEAYNNLGVILYEQGNFSEAEERFQRAITFKPDYAEAHYNLGNTLKDQLKSESAVASYQRALILKPDYLEVLYNLGVLFRESGRLGEAATNLRRALSIKPDHIDALDNLAGVLKEQGNLDEAATCMQKALALNPDYAEMHYNLGVILRELGKLDEAAACYRKALSLKPAYAAPFKDLTAILKFSEPDDAVQNMEHIYNKEDISQEDRITLGFALGKVFEDLGEYDKAAEYIFQANLLKRGTYEYSIQGEQDFFARIKKTFSPDFFASHNNSGHQDKTPVFILGMPRSGTTLVEQILASHPLVFGAGELALLTNLTDKICDAKATAQYPECIASLGPGELERAGVEYIAAIRKYSENTKHITDKMPYNFLHVGLIKTILPEAKVIHCTRNPMDNCFSLFKNYFKETHGYAYDLIELGKYYKLYSNLMEHWEKVLPGFMYTVKYEELVTDQENQTKNLLNFCELFWDESCLAFHKTQRKVSTASLAQVRRPIYKDSVELWKHYEKQLEPLKKLIHG